MAKQAPKSGGSSRIRFIMLDADLADGDVSQITQAIQNAFRPAGGTPQTKTILATPPAVVAREDEPEIDMSEFADDETEHRRPERPKTARRNPSTPNVIEFDFTSDVSLAQFATKANPQSDRKRYLVVAAWFKEHRNISAITVHHVYTAYRHMKWSCNITDFSQPLRNLKSDKLFHSPERGSFAINHLGLAEVTSLSKEPD